MDRDARTSVLRWAAASAVALLALTGCSPSDEGEPPVAPAPSEATGSPTVPTESPTEGATEGSPAATPEVTVETVVDGLDVPWGLAPLPDGALLVSLRDAARLVVVDPDAGTTTEVTGPGADMLAAESTPDGEGGLLGVARDPGSGDVFVYRTGADDNAVLRGTLDGGGADGWVLGELTTILDGIPRAGHHDGGALAFGPDGDLYVGTGDAGDGQQSQDPVSLGGKILRVTTDGDPAPGNPDPASPVWTSGHRNVQGLGWDASGRMFASEFGQNTWDELNEIEPGGNYGWPDVEGPDGAGDGTVAPVAWWSTSEASPSGLAVTDDAVYLAGLRGERLWRVPFGETDSGAEESDESGGESPEPSKGSGVDADGSVRALGDPQPLLVEELGRLRNVAPVVAGGGDGDGLWVLTNNTDGRGTPRDGDDRLVRVTLG